ncbi:unnamed protein product [Effrenium voratum]|nr:unnamed protein product [Effrenium voratum]
MTLFAIGLSFGGPKVIPLVWLEMLCAGCIIFGGPPATKSTWPGDCFALGGGENLRLAAMVGLGHHCLLRTGELLNLQFQDICLGERSGVVNLHFTKSGKRSGTAEAATITDPMVWQILDTLITVCPATGPVWGSSAQKFRMLFGNFVTFSDWVLLFQTVQSQKGRRHIPPSVSPDDRAYFVEG